MARSPYTFAKRQRQLEKQKKKAEKQKRKEEGAPAETAEEYNPYLAMREETMEYSEALDKEDEDEENQES